MKILMCLMISTCTFLAIANDWQLKTLSLTNVHPPLVDHRIYKLGDTVGNENKSRRLYVKLPNADDEVEQKKFAVIDRHPSQNISTRNWVKLNNSWHATPEKSSIGSSPMPQFIATPNSMIKKLDETSQQYYLVSLPPKHNGKQSEFTHRFVYDDSDWNSNSSSRGVR